MKSKNKPNYKLGLYFGKEMKLLPISSIEINVKIINKFAKLELIHIYKNPYKENIDATFFIPKECIKIFNSLNIEYNGQSYESIIGIKPKNIIKYSENNYIEILKIKKYIFFPLKVLEPEKEIKIKLSFIEDLEIYKNKILYIIPDIYIPKIEDDKISYNYKFEINAINTKKIRNFICNQKDIEFEQKNEYEFILKYFKNNIQKKNIYKKFFIQYEIEENNEPDIILMKHPLYENDYACYFSINPKFIIKEKEKENEKKTIDNIIIIIDEYYLNINEIIKSIVYLLKSLPEKSCYFNILYLGPLFDEFLQINENNIKKAIKIIESYSNNTRPNLLDNIKFVKNIKEQINRVFIIGQENFKWSFKIKKDLDNILKDIDEISKYNCKFYTITNPYLYNSYEGKDISEEIKEISRRTNGHFYFYYNKSEIPDVLIKSYEESIEDYIHDLSISFTNEDDNLICIQKEKYYIKSNIELLINMKKNNEIKMEFKFRGKKYLYSYNINFENDKITNDDMLHKIFYNEYYKEQMLIEDKIINILNKYQILANLNELYIDLKDDQKSLEQKINTKREKEYIFKSKVGKINVIMKSLTGKEHPITLYYTFSIKELKIIYELITGIFFKFQRYVFKGIGLEDKRILSDYNIMKDGEIIHVILRFDRFIKFINKNSFDLYNYEEVYFLIKNQRINGLWEANLENIELIKKLGMPFANFSKKFKDICLINDNDIIFTIFVISFLNTFPYRKRFHYILEKSYNLLKEKINDYNEEKQREFNKLIQY